MISIENSQEPSKIKVYGRIKPQLTEYADGYYVIWLILFPYYNF